MPKKTVLVFGTFDPLHPGHHDLFAQAARLGQVVVVVARDQNVYKIKKNPTQCSERSRLGVVAHAEKVTRARLGNRTDFLRPVIEEQPDIIALGYDQKTFTPANLASELQKHGLAPKIVRLKAFHPEKYKSSKLKKLSKLKT
jgi:cytidyltransferase-like protein